ncbi:pentatricopeptide repeat-containing protein mitochondrial [Dorcoceras hygrometricum]|uniref:Pentatricopeptide repeat-containing protein mitochondrial n=1 Tax=Dorcoceras hygrometricum TaxID=472368 RepID=A0A2Z7D6B2_9LAMI|nr:pentatricopeptide repeat-containing protein mitochondrial [Dorcoceras hygrometricum]
MALAFITNALQVNFDSVLGIHNNEEMVQMFCALEATGLRGFLGCPSVLYEQELEQFFDTALVQDGDITCVVFVDELVQFSCKKRLMKYEFRLLNDILAKSITVKAGSFDAITHERFLMMTAIHFGIKVNWSNIRFEVLKEMADRTTKRAKGFAAQICVLFKGDPAVTLGEAKTSPPLKILSAKTVNTYITTNKTIDARGESDEPDVAKVAIVNKKSVSKKKSDSIADKDADDVHVEVVAEKAVSKKRPAPVSEATVVKKKRTTSGKAVSKKKYLALISVAQDVVQSTLLNLSPLCQLSVLMLRSEKHQRER